MHDDIHILGIGAFGQETARGLAELLPGSGCTLLAPDAILRSGDLEPASLYISASWRPHPPLERLLDRVAAAWRVRWLPIVADHPVLRIGPMVGPGQACHDCLRRRLRQARPASAIESDVLRHYEADPLSGPRGFLHSHAELAASVAARMVTEPGRQPLGPATIWTYHLFSQVTRTSRLIPRHRCPNCRGPRPTPPQQADALLHALGTGAGR